MKTCTIKGCVNEAVYALNNPGDEADTCAEHEREYFEHRLSDDDRTRLKGYAKIIMDNNVTMKERVEALTRYAEIVDDECGVYASVQDVERFRRDYTGGIQRNVIR